MGYPGRKESALEFTRGLGYTRTMGVSIFERRLHERQQMRQRSGSRHLTRRNSLAYTEWCPFQAFGFLTKPKYKQSKKRVKWTMERPPLI